MNKFLPQRLTESLTSLPANSAAREQALKELILDLSSQLDLEMLATRSLEHALIGTACDLAGIAELDQAGGVFRYRWLAGFPAGAERQMHDFPMGSGLAGAVVAAGQAVTVRDYQHSPVALPEFRALGLTAAIGTPVYCRGEVTAVLCVGRRDGPQDFGERELTWLGIVAHQLGLGYEREAMNRELRDSEARLREVIESMPGLIYHVHLPNEVVEFVGPQLRSLAGLDPEQLTGRPRVWEQLIHPEDWPALQEKMRRAIHQRRGELTAEYRIRRADSGAIVWLRDRSHIQYDESGRAWWITGVISDISELKASIAGQQTAERRAAALVRQLPVAIASIDRHATVLEHNPAAALLVGAEESASLIGRNITEFLAPGEWDRFQQRMQEDLANRSSGLHRYEIRRLDGSTGHAESNAVLIQGSQPPRLAFFARDISEQAEAEAALQRSQRELATVTEHSPDAIIRFDTQLRVNFVNPAVERYTGIPARAMLGLKLGDVPAPQHAIEHFEASLKAALTNDAESSLQLSCATPQGQRDFAGRVVVERDDDNQITGLLTVTRDVTDLVESQNALEQKNRDLGARVKERTALLELTRLAADHSVGEKDLVNKAARLIAPACQEPDKIGVLVRLDNRVLARRNWQVGRASCRCDIHVDGAKLGSLQITRNDLADGAADAFSPEVVDLLHALADALSNGVAWRRLQARERRLSRARDALSGVARAVVHARSEKGLLRGVCRAIVKASGYRMAWFGYARHDSKCTIEPVTWAGHNRGYVEQMDASWADGPRGGGPVAVAIRSGQPQHENMLSSAPSFRPWAEAARQRGYGSMAALPVSLDEKDRGVLAIYAHERNAFAPRELKLLQELADELGHGLRALRAEQARRIHEEARREMVAQRERIVERSSDGLLIVDQSGIVRFANTAAAKLFRSPRRDLIGQPLDLPASEGNWSEIELCPDSNHPVQVELRTVPTEWHGDPAQLLILHDLTERRRAERDRLEHSRQLERSLTQTIAAVAMTVDKRDPYTSGHQRRVAKLAMAIAQRLGMNKGRVDGIGLGAQIHDIGKISVPSEILSRPSRLNGPEWELVKLHPQTGFEIIKDIQFPWPVAQMVLQHHERLDGSGYPFGLKGSEILLEARILAVADTVEAMASHRPYRAGLGIDAALQEIRAQSGVKYDAKVVEACLWVFANGFELGASHGTEETA